MMIGLSEIQRLTPDEKHRLYTDQNPEALARAEAVLEGKGPRVLLLSGEPGCGRTDFLEAAAQSARLSGRPVAVIPLDLDGFEDGLDLTRFADLRIASCPGLETPDREALKEKIRPLLAFLPPTLAGAAVTALLLEADDPVAVFKTLPQSTAGDARPALGRLLEALAGSGTLVLHVVDSYQLHNPLRRWLVEETGRRSSFVLALSCSPTDPDDRLLVPGLEGERIELTPLSGDDLPSGFKELMDDLEIDLSDRLQRFLDLAALCGRNVPAELLFHHLELDEEGSEELLDLIDEELVDKEASTLFVDHQYGHPSFPGLLTYAFVDPRLRHTLLEPVTRVKRERMASELLDFVNKSVAIHTRGMTLLRLSLASHLEETKARDFFLRELRVWITPAESEDFSRELSEGLAAGRMSVQDLLGTASQTDGHWPAHRRLPFLDAVRHHPGDLSPTERVELYNLRTEALRELGRRDEALAEANLSLEASEGTFGANHAATARALNLQGILLREAGRPAEARTVLERALSLQSSAEAANVASILANLGTALRDLGEKETARDHLEKALALHLQAFGPSHSTIIVDRANLSSLLRDLGDLEQALDHLRRILDIVRQLYGDVHPETARALTNVAGLLRDLGEKDGARLHLEAALQIDQQALGEHHPQVVADLNNLAVIEKEIGQIEDAREHFAHALALARGTLGEDHPLTAQIRRAAED